MILGRRGHTTACQASRHVVGDTIKGRRQLLQGRLWEILKISVTDLSLKAQPHFLLIQHDDLKYKVKVVAMALVAYP